MSDDDKKGEDEPKGVDLAQMEEDMEESRMDRLTRGIRRDRAERQAAQAAGGPPPKPAR